MNWMKSVAYEIIKYIFDQASKFCFARKKSFFQKCDYMEHKVIIINDAES